MNRVALVEDNDRLGGLVRKALAASGIESDLFIRMDSAWQALHSASYAAIIVDRGLPDGDGLQLVRRLRSSANLLPCLMLTARDAVHDRIEGLESGADDYLVKPFSMDELVARVRALLRRPVTNKALNPEFADLSVSPTLAVMVCRAQSAPLAATELQIMLSLVHAQGEVVRREKLELAAWGLSDAVTPNALDVAMHRLRRKLQSIDSALHIANSRGNGYSLRCTQDDA